MVSNPAQLPGPLAWLQAGKGKRPGSAFSSSLIFFFFFKKEKEKAKKSKEHSPGTRLYFQMSSQQEEGCGRAKGVTSNYRTISTYELAQGAACVSELSVGRTTLLSSEGLQLP